MTIETLRGRYRLHRFPPRQRGGGGATHTPPKITPQINSPLG